MKVTGIRRFFFLNPSTASHFFFSVCFFFLKKNGKKIRYFKKKKMSLDSYTEKRKLNSALPARRPRSAGLGGSLGGTRGQVRGPCPPLVLGRTPIGSPPPTPHPGTAHFGIGRNEECGKYLKAAAGAREVAGGRMGGSRGRVVPRDRVETLPLPGVQASRAPPGSGRGVWSRWSLAGRPWL